MSDYEVSLVNDNMQEFYVRFHGPAESMRHLVRLSMRHVYAYAAIHSALRQRGVEDPRRAPGPVPVQIAEYRVHEQDLPPEY